MGLELGGVSVQGIHPFPNSLSLSLFLSFSLSLALSPCVYKGVYIYINITMKLLHCLLVVRNRPGPYITLGNKILAVVLDQPKREE